MPHRRRSMLRRARHQPPRGNSSWRCSRCASRRRMPAGNMMLSIPPIVWWLASWSAVGTRRHRRPVFLCRFDNPHIPYDPELRLKDQDRDGTPSSEEIRHSSTRNGSLIGYSFFYPRRPLSAQWLESFHGISDATEARELQSRRGNGEARAEGLGRLCNPNSAFRAAMRVYRIASGKI
jgi:hypothetical protein